jgi:hypothetical protein
MDNKNLSGRNDPSDGEDEADNNINAEHGKLEKYDYVQYWYCFAEKDPGLFKSMNLPLPEGAFSDTSTPQSSSSGANHRGVTKRRKSTEVYEKVLRQNQDIQAQNVQFQEKFMEQHERTIVIQNKTSESQQKRIKTAEKRASIAEKQLMALESHLRTERLQQAKQEKEMKIRILESDIQAGMENVKNLKKEHSLLKQRFVNHCKRSNEAAKQDHRARRKDHNERVAARSDNIDSDSDESLDSQAPLLNEIEGVKAVLDHANKRLEANEESLRVSKNDGVELDDTERGINVNLLPLLDSEHDQSFHP